MSGKKWLVPDVVNPAETVCVTLQIPKDANHINAFWGALEQLGKAYNWEDSFVDGSATAYVWQNVLDDASELVRQEVNCMLDCDEVEDCIEASPAIIVIEGDIINNTTTIDGNTTNITNNTTEITNITENPPDGTIYAESPDFEVDSDPACGAAFYVVARIRAFILELEGYPVAHPTILDAMEAAIDGDFSLSVTIFQAVLETLFDPVPPASVLVDFDAQASDMRYWLYCNGFVKADFVTYVRTLTSGDAIGDFIDCLAFSAWQSWVSIGMMDDTQDCTGSPCATWCVELTVANHLDWFTPYDHLDGNGDRATWDAVNGWGRGPAAGVKHLIHIFIGITPTNIDTVEVFTTGTPTNTHQLRMPDVLGTDFFGLVGGSPDASYAPSVTSAGFWIGHDMTVGETDNNYIYKVRIAGTGPNPFPTPINC